MSEKPSSAVPRLDAAIAVVLASIAPFGAIWLVSAIPAVGSLRNKEQVFMWWAFEAAALLFVGVAFGVGRGREGTSGVRLRSIFLLPASYSAIWIFAFVILAIVQGPWRDHAGPIYSMIGALLGAPVGAAFAALVAIRPSAAISRRRAVKLGALSAVPGLVLFAAWFASDEVFGARRASIDYGLFFAFVVTIVLLALACAVVAAPLLVLLTMRSDRS